MKKQEKIPVVKDMTGNAISKCIFSSSDSTADFTADLFDTEYLEVLGDCFSVN